MRVLNLLLCGEKNLLKNKKCWGVREVMFVLDLGFLEDRQEVFQPVFLKPKYLWKAAEVSTRARSSSTGKYRGCKKNRDLAGEMEVVKSYSH